MFYLIIIFWVILDLFSKNLAYKYLQDQVNILWDFLSLKYAENTWVAFSTQIPWLKYITIFLIIWIFYYYFLEKKQNNSNKKLLDLIFWLILAWAVWNWIERIFNWKVIDFICVKYFSVFNLADAFISIWVFIYLLMLLWVFDHKKEK